MQTKFLVDTKKGTLSVQEEVVVKTITSLELLEQINEFRKLDSTKERSELKHYDLLKVIRDEFEEEIGAGKISETPYIHPQNGQEYPLFNLTYSQAKQVLVRESKFVRKHVIQRLEELEEELKNSNQIGLQDKLLLNIMKAGDPVDRALRISEYQEQYVIPLENGLIETSKKLEHKTEVLNGVVEDIDIHKQRDLLNRIVRYKGSDYQERWSEIYKVFKERKHIDISARKKGYNLKNTPKCKTNLEYAEKFGYVTDLYEIAIKLYESDYKEIINNIHKKF